MAAGSRRLPALSSFFFSLLSSLFFFLLSSRAVSCLSFSFAKRLDSSRAEVEGAEPSRRAEVEIRAGEARDPKLGSEAMRDCDARGADALAGGIYSRG